MLLKNSLYCLRKPQNRKTVKVLGGYTGRNINSQVSKHRTHVKVEGHRQKAKTRIYHPSVQARSSINWVKRGMWKASRKGEREEGNKGAIAQEVTD